MATIKDIAQKAGVSTMTVSNIIHGRMARVSNETAQKVTKLIKEMGYTPNMYARSLVNNTSKVVTYIKVKTNVSGNSFMSDPFTAAFIDALEHSLAEIGYFLMLKTVTGAEDLKTFLGNWKVDGIVIVGLCDTAILDVLGACTIPTVLIDSCIGLPSIQSIRIDDEKGGFLATEYLLRSGHKNIAAVAPSFHENSLNLDRLEGYRKALSTYEIPFCEDFCFDCNQLTIKAVVKKIQERGVSAVFAFSDVLAIELIREFHLNHVHIPEDISIIGFDDIPLCTLVTPTLTTIHQDTQMKGELAAQYVIDLLQKPEQTTANEIMMPVSIVERESVRPL